MGCSYCFFLSVYGHYRDLHGLTHAFPTRRLPISSGPASVKAAARASRSSISAGVSRPRAVSRRRRVSGVAVISTTSRPGYFARAASITARETLITRSEEQTSELQSLMRSSYAVFCLKQKTDTQIVLYRQTT